MPRRARLSIAGVPWHIVQRGNNRSACFHAVDDYRRYLCLLAGIAPHFGCSVHAYVLMTNHVHLLLTPAEHDSAALMMKHLGQRYTHHVNLSYQRTGSLWEGRFRSCLIQTERYFFACQRYIELNPVRAGMVLHPSDYRWSSFRANADGVADPLLVPHPQYLALGREPQARRTAYRALFEDHLENPVVDRIRDATRQNIALGDERFARMVDRVMRQRLGDRP